MGSLFGLLGMLVIGVGIIGWLWIAVIAFGEGDTLWGIGCLVFSPLCIVYGFLNMQELKVPLALVLVGFVGRIGIGVLAAALA